MKECYQISDASIDNRGSSASKKLKVKRDSVNNGQGTSEEKVVCIWILRQSEPGSKHHSGPDDQDAWTISRWVLSSQEQFMVQAAWLVIREATAWYGTLLGLLSVKIGLATQATSKPAGSGHETWRIPGCRPKVAGRASQTLKSIIDHCAVDTTRGVADRLEEMSSWVGIREVGTQQSGYGEAHSSR